MVRQYVQVTDQMRVKLVKLIHQDNFSIAKAAKVTNIPYDNAKAINRTYVREQRVSKIDYRERYQTRRNRQNQAIIKQNSNMKITLNLDSENTVSEQQNAQGQSPGKSDLQLVNQEYYARPQNDESANQTIPRNHEDAQMMEDQSVNKTTIDEKMANSNSGIKLSLSLQTPNFGNRKASIMRKIQEQVVISNKLEANSVDDKISCKSADDSITRIGTKIKQNKIEFLSNNSKKNKEDLNSNKNSQENKQFQKTDLKFFNNSIEPTQKLKESALNLNQMHSIRTPVFVNGYKDLDIDMKQSQNNKNKTTSEISPSDLLFIPEAKETTKGSTQRLTRADMSVRLSQALGNIKNLNQRERNDSYNSISDIFSNHNKQFNLQRFETHDKIFDCDASVGSGYASGKPQSAFMPHHSFYKIRKSQSPISTISKSPAASFSSVSHVPKDQKLKESIELLRQALIKPTPLELELNKIRQQTQNLNTMVCNQKQESVTIPSVLLKEFLNNQNRLIDIVQLSLQNKNLNK